FCFSSRIRHTRFSRDWSSDVCSSDLLTYAVRNTLVVAGIAVIIGRSIGVMLGMLSGYIGGTFDRIASSIVDSFIVIPRLPLVIRSEARSVGTECGTRSAACPRIEVLI